MCALAVALLCLLPLGFIAWAAAETGPARIVEVVWRPRVGELLLNTVALVAVVVPATVVIGVAQALLVERTSLPGRRLLSVLFVAPLAVPAFVASYAWATVWPSISGLLGASVVSVAAYAPFVYLPVLASVRRLDPALEESGRSLGLSGPATLARVVLPQLRLSVLGGSLLVALHLLAEYGAFAYVRFDTFTTAIYDQYRSTFAGPAASMLAGVLVLLCLAVLAGDASVRGRHRHARLGGGSARQPRLVALGVWSVPALAATAALIAATLGVPAYALVRWLSLTTGLDGDLVGALVSTLAYAALGGVVTCLAALPVAWLSERRATRWPRVVEAVTYIGSSLPGMVVGLAFVAIALRATPALYQTPVVLVAAYVVLFLPRAVATLRGGIAQAPRSLEETARTLGCTPAAAFCRVTLPILAPALGAAAALTFLGVAGELTATLLLAPTGTETLATRFWSLSSEIDYPGAAPYALALVALSVPMTALLFRQSREG